MADPQTTSAVAISKRQDVDLPGAGLAPAPQPSARPVPITLPGVPTIDDSAARETTQNLQRALGVANTALEGIGNEYLKEDRDEQFKQGQMKAQESQEKFADAVAKGIIPQAANPWFVKGYQNQDGRVQGLDYYSAMQSAYLNSPAKGNDDPAAYQTFLADFKKNYMASLPADRSSDWWDGFRQTSTTADERMSREHAEDVTRAVVAKQEANTGVEANTILNTSSDPAVAAARLSQLGDRMRLEGMPAESVDSVISQSVLAKAKNGNGAFLATLDLVKQQAAGGKDGATLSSNPRVANARVDVSQFLTQQARSAQEFAWRAEEHNYQVTVTRPRAAKEFAEHEEAWERQKDNWSREDQTRNILARIQSGVMANPEAGITGVSAAIRDLNSVNPAEVERAVQFAKSYPFATDNLSPQQERPFVSKFNSDILDAAGNPAAQLGVQKNLMDALSAHQINQQTFDKLRSDSIQMGSYDVANARLINSPEMEQLFATVKQGMTAAGKYNPAGILFGGPAYDFLDIKTAGQKAAQAFLEKNPHANVYELVDAARKGIDPVIRGMGYTSGLDKSLGSIDRFGEQAKQGLRRLGDPSLAPANVEPAQAIKQFSQEEQKVFLQTIAQLHTTNPQAIPGVIARFDQEHHSPGLAQLILDTLSLPRPMKKEEAQQYMKAMKTKQDIEKENEQDK